MAGPNVAVASVEAEILTLLEKKVEHVMRVLAELRAERDGLREELAAQELRTRELEAAAATAEGSRDALRRLETERDALARERAGIARRIEGILARLDVVGLD